MRIHLKIWELDKNEEMRRGQQTVRSDIGARIFDSRAGWWYQFQYRAGLICRKGSDATSKSSLWFQSFWCEKVCCSNFWNHQYLPLILIIWSASSCLPVITGANMCTSYICSSVCVTNTCGEQNCTHLWTNCICWCEIYHVAKKLDIKCMVPTLAWIALIPSLIT